MVGVPGRSKACHTCRQRKIACTLERPRCAQCLKSKRVCTGYQRERIFVSLHGSAPDSLKPSKGWPVSFAEPEPASTCRTVDDALPPISHEHRGRSATAVDTEPLWHPTEEVSVRHAFRQQLLGQFIYSYLPDSLLALQRSILGGYYTSWLVLIAELPQATTALETSILAMTAAKIGRMNDDPVLVKASLRSYVQGLWELQKALWDPNLMYRDETLAACMSLWMFEVMECPAETPRAWISHFDGCKRLIELRGPKAHTSALAHQVFLSYRSTAIYQAIKFRQTSYLADPDWIELPWKNVPKTTFDRLLDKTATLANLFVQGFEIEGLEPARLLRAALEIVDRCWKIEAELKAFYEDLERDNRGSLYWPKLSTEDNPADDAVHGKVFPVAFHFPDLKTAFTCMIYWASSILVWAILSHMYQLLGSLQTHGNAADGHAPTDCPRCPNANRAGSAQEKPCTCDADADKPPPPATPDSATIPFDTSHLPPINPRIDVLSAVRNICQSAEYCMQEEMKALGPTATVIPLMAVIDALQNIPGYDRELAWTKAMFGKVNGRGFRLMSCLDNRD